MKPRKKFVAMSLLMIVALTMGIAWAGSNSTTLPNGAALQVSIDSPVTSTEFLVPTGDTSVTIHVTGDASVGKGEPGATFVYVMDVSGSTGLDSGEACGTVLQCEQAFMESLNTAVIADGSVNEVGLAVYADSGATADMSPDAGDQTIVAPDADTYVNTVVASTYSDLGGGNGGVAQYTNKAVGQFTNFTAGLQSALAIVNASTNSINIVVFVSDGLSNAGGAGFAGAVSDLANAGAVVYTIAAGASSSCSGGTDGTLQQIADGTGGTCTELQIGNLPSIIPDLVSSSLDSLTIEVDGGGETTIPNADISLPLPQPGAVSVTYDTTVADLGVGDHEICVTAYGHDSAGKGSVTQCETVHMLQISLAPATATNELGTPGQTHTVTATIAGDPSEVAGRIVDFDILSGPNAGMMGSGLTDSSGVVTFTYTATQGLAGIGTDTIQGCTTLNDPTGATGCDEVTKVWEDTTPPDVSCIDATNPHGKTIPPASNQDGFFQLIATDAVDPNPQIYVEDTGTGTVFGPFASGTLIKYVQAPGASPQQKKIGSTSGQAGAVAWQIIGQGDPCVYAVDASGNQSQCTSCLVPPPPQ